MSCHGHVFITIIIFASIVVDKVEKRNHEYFLIVLVLLFLSNHILAIQMDWMI